MMYVVPPASKYNLVWGNTIMGKEKRKKTFDEELLWVEVVLDGVGGGVWGDNFFSWDTGVTPKVSRFDNWKLQKSMWVSACVFVDYNILTVTPDYLLAFFSSFWCSDSLPTTSVMCFLMRVVILVEIAAKSVCNILVFLFKLNTHCQIIIIIILI